MTESGRRDRNPVLEKGDDPDRVRAGTGQAVEDLVPGSTDHRKGRKVIHFSASK